MIYVRQKDDNKVWNTVREAESIEDLPEPLSTYCAMVWATDTKWLKGVGAMYWNHNKEPVFYIDSKYAVDGP